MYQKIIVDGYIVSIASGVSSGNMTEDEYNTILEVIRSKPNSPEGYDYRLLEDLSWELCELPEPDEDATEADYEESLRRFGV